MDSAATSSDMYSGGAFWPWYVSVLHVIRSAWTPSSDAPPRPVVESTVVVRGMYPISVWHDTHVAVNVAMAPNMPHDGSVSLRVRDGPKYLLKVG